MQGFWEKKGRQDTRNPLQQLREFCAKQDWRIGTEYVDERFGKNGDRPQFQAMLDADSRGEFDVVLFWSLDRLIKEVRWQHSSSLELLTSYGVGYHSLTEAIRTSSGPFGRRWWRYSGVSLGKGASAFLSGSEGG